jgi:hypothetical protein
MSDDHHVEPKNPDSRDLVNRLFVISMAGVLSFIAVVFAFVIL